MRPNNVRHFNRRFALVPALAAGLPLLGAAAAPLLVPAPPPSSPNLAGRAG